jgi:ubiquinone/menaquinone biosynthesis C-methylase UbiE
MSADKSYVHALRYQKLNWLYDPIVRLTTRERTVKAKLTNALSGHSGRLLDLACGSGTLAILIKQHFPHLTVQGVDGDPDMLGRAERKATEAGSDIGFQQGLADALPFGDSSFDVVVSSLFFHHLSSEEKRSAFREIKRVLAPSGVLLLADWGRPRNILMRVLFFPVRLLDGLDNTRDNVQGKLPTLIRESGFARVVEIGDVATPLGTISIIRAGM